MELIHPVLGTKRVWPDRAELTARNSEVGAALQARPVKLARDSGPGGIVTIPRVQEHAFYYWQTPVLPERARQILLSALSGYLQGQYDLFCLMEDQWDRLSKDLNEVKNAVKRLSWMVTPYAERGKEPTPKAQEKADLVEAALRNWEPRVGTLEYGFEDCIYHALDAMGKGISVQEIHWAPQNGIWRPEAAHFLTPRSYGWSPDGIELGLSRGTYALSSPLSDSYAFQPFPENQFLVGNWYARSGLPGATAMLRPLVPYWIGMTYGWQWLMQTAQIFGVPFRWATYDPTQPGLVNTVSDMLQNLGSAGWAAFPAGTTLDFKEAVTNAKDNPQALIIELAKQACDLTILHQELSSESKSSGLGSGNAVLQGSVRQDVLHGAAHWVSDLLNYQLVPGVIRLNFGETSELPTIAPDLSIDPDPKALADRDAVLAQATDVKISAKEFYERHGLRMPEEGEAVISGKSAATALQMAGNGDAKDGMEDGGRKTEDGSQKVTKETKKDGEQEPVEAKAALEAKAMSDATDKLVESATGVEEKWLGGVKPYFRNLVALAASNKITDQDFVTALERSRKEMPELFAKLDTKALADHLEAAMGAACVNGALQGYMARRTKH
jgi:phage gp29-like protein